MLRSVDGLFGGETALWRDLERASERKTRENFKRRKRTRKRERESEGGEKKKTEGYGEREKEREGGPGRNRYLRLLSFL